MHYFDHAASSPARAVVAEAVAEELLQSGNPASVHAAGRRARSKVDDVREQLAAAAGLRPHGVVFTSGGTESNNLALKGTWWSPQRDPERTIIVAPRTEHLAVIDPIGWLVARQGAQVHWLAVDEYGRPDVTAAREYLANNHQHIAIMTAMWVNNETGVLNPITQLAAAAAEYNIPFHCDAAQAFGRLETTMLPGITSMTITGHKLGGPVGTGALFVGSQPGPTPLQHGGGQEAKMRSGTLDAAAITGLGVAVEHAMANNYQETSHLQTLSTQLRDGLSGLGPDVQLTIPDDSDATSTPHIVHARFRGCRGETLLYVLDQAGICVSTGSACSAGVAQPSHVLAMLGWSDDDVRSALRFSTGHSSTADDVAALLAALPDAIASTQQATAKGSR